MESIKKKKKEKKYHIYVNLVCGQKLLRIEYVCEVIIYIKLLFFFIHFIRKIISCSLSDATVSSLFISSLNLCETNFSRLIIIGINFTDFPIDFFNFTYIFSMLASALRPLYFYSQSNLF